MTDEDFEKIDELIQRRIKEALKDIGYVDIQDNDIIKEWYNNIPIACQHCSNHPINGGNGICHCILGLPEIT